MPPWLPERGARRVRERARAARRPDRDHPALGRRRRRRRRRAPTSRRCRTGPRAGSSASRIWCCRCRTPISSRPRGSDVFRNFVVPVPLTSTRYVRAIEFRAGNPRSLHHASVGVDRLRVSRKVDRGDREPGLRRDARRSGGERLRLVAGQSAVHGAGRPGVDARARQRPRPAVAHAADRRARSRSSRASACSFRTGRRARAAADQARIQSRSTFPPVRPTTPSTIATCCRPTSTSSASIRTRTTSRRR